jgi:hypothetical protein
VPEHADNRFAVEQVGVVLNGGYEPVFGFGRHHYKLVLGDLSFQR